MGTIFVTGGAGFIGSHLCEALLARGERLVAYDSFDDFYDPVVKKRNLEKCRDFSGFDMIEGDIRDTEAIDTAVRCCEPETIVHLAARVGVRASIKEYMLFKVVNVSGTAQLLDTSRRRGVIRFIFSSSSSVYGNNQKIPFAEADPVGNPTSPYAATKHAGELLCRTHQHRYGIGVTCLRLFTVYGPRLRPDLAIHKFARLMLDGVPIPVFGDGTTRRDYTYVADIVDGFLRVLHLGDGFRVFNLGRSKPVSLTNLIAALESSIGRKAVIDRRPPHPADVQRTHADISRARAELGYDPSTNLVTGLKHIIDWLRSSATPERR